VEQDTTQTMPVTPSATTSGTAPRRRATTDVSQAVTALFASDSAPTGWMGADMGGVRLGDVVAVWGCGAVGQVAARSAQLLGAERVVVIDRFDYRLEMAERELGVEVVNHERTDVHAELRERSGGRGPDVCIEAIGMGGPRARATVPLRAGQAARRALHPDAAGADGQRRAQDGPSGHPPDAAGREAPGDTTCSRTRRTAACGRCSDLTRK
jgi:hypothetical protein